jgi:exodeoxyribonuclease III
MRIVTWNCCRGPYSVKVPLLESMAFDIAVVQECARPDVESDTCLWFGDNARQGIAVRASNGYRVRALPRAADVPKFAFPVQVIGPESFTLLAVWSKGGQKFRYVRAVVKAVQVYRALFEASPTVLIGDLNSNAIWDTDHPAGLNHAALVSLLSELGLVSSYHYFFGEAQGSETRPTLCLLRNKDRPYHIDYCFVPVSWAPRIKHVEIGSYDDWKKHSDHRPLLVEVSRGAL